MKKITVIVANDDKFYITTVREAVKNLTDNITCCSNLNEVFNELSSLEYDFLITDYVMFNEDLSISSFVNTFTNTDLIIVSSKPSYSQGSNAVCQGAKDYIDLKGCISLLADKMITLCNDKKTRAKLKENLLNNYLLESKNESYNKMIEQCEKVAKSKANVLLIGESGTGKEVAAKYIHLCSNRCSNNFVAVNCSSYTETLLESELFGYEQGSFTGAVKSKQGKFEVANNGTLFLDEVGEINISIQVKLLRVLESKRVERLGSNKEKLIDFKLISATNRDLASEVVRENFREDFFYRISSIVIKVPPLRERKEDLNSLINYFLELSQKENDIEIKYIEPEVKLFLENYNYPGNIRELKSIIDRMVVLSSDGIINKDGIPILFNIHKKISNSVDIFSGSKNFDKIVPFKKFKIESESNYLQWVLNQTEGNVAEAARKLEISSRQLFNKINEYNLKK